MYVGSLELSTIQDEGMAQTIIVAERYLCLQIIYIQSYNKHSPATSISRGVFASATWGISITDNHG